jgi:hypothetical protein
VLGDCSRTREGKFEGRDIASMFICCSGPKLPAFDVSKGRDAKMQTTLESHIARQRETISDNGWMTDQIMVQYLRWLEIAMGPAPFAFVVDAFPGHLTQRVRLERPEMISMKSK